MTASADRSKKQFGWNLTLRPEPLVFFVDRSLGRRVVPNALRDAGAQVEVHDDHFPQDAQDQVWLAEAGKRGWAVLTKDKHIRHRALEVNALISAEVRAFVLAARGDLSGAEIGQIFVKARPAMRRLCATASPPFVAHVSRDSSVSVIKSLGAGALDG
jgi:predicted nuclease of predicted toxin-antitoxin system